MNKEAVVFCQNWLVKNLSLCTEPQIRLFKQMYCKNNFGLSVQDAVACVQEDKLDWAMQQVERTLEKNKRKNHEPLP